jgi:hypothetical protein
MFVNVNKKVFVKNDQVSVTVGVGCRKLDDRFLVELSNRQGNATRWVLGQSVVSMSAEDSGSLEFFSMTRESMITHIQRNVDGEAVEDLNGWDHCKILLINEKVVVDIKSKKATESKNRFVAKQISVDKEFLGGHCYFFCCCAIGGQTWCNKQHRRGKRN